MYCDQLFEDKQLTNIAMNRNICCYTFYPFTCFISIIYVGVYNTTFYTAAFLVLLISSRLQRRHTFKFIFFLFFSDM